MNLHGVTRGHGRDDDPVRAMWNALLAGIVFQHDSDAKLLRELSRNGQLRRLCGFKGKAPAASAFSRFVKRVLDELPDVVAIFDQLVQQARCFRISGSVWPWTVHQTHHQVLGYLQDQTGH